MRASEVVKPYHFTVSAQTHFEARQLMKKMYSIPDYRIGSLRLVKSG